jgi:transglutaminase-like putative cysteine protease
MQFTIRHQTTYRYADAIHESYTVCHLQPFSDVEQYCTHFELSSVPRAKMFSYADRFGNRVHHFSVIPEHPMLVISSRSTVVTARSGDAAAASAEASRRALLADAKLVAFYDFLQPSPLVEFGPDLTALSNDIGEPGEDLLAWYLHAGTYIKEHFEYVKRATNVRTTVAESVRLRAGVCQDFAHVLIALCRNNAIPARYVSGYIFSGQPDSVLGAEASHAWCEAYLPPLGWVGYDPTNAKLVNDYFVKIAVGRDYRDVSPVRGVYKGLAHSTMSVNVALDELYDAERATELEAIYEQQQQ